MSAAGEVLGPVLAVVAGGFVSWIVSALANKRNQRQAAMRADGEAYERAQRINSEVVDGLRAEITRLQHELDGMRQVVRDTQAQNTALERHVAALERSVHRLRVLLQQHGIPLPEHT